MVKSFTLDCARFGAQASVHAYLAAALALPDWYGRNLDALYDCLTDLGPCALVLVDAPAARDGGYGAKVLQVFEDAARENAALDLEYRPALMRTLFSLDGENYDPRWSAYIRPSVRGVVLRDGRIAMVHSLKYDYYKFPGGGVEAGEDHLLTLAREVREEAGLTVLPGSAEPYGLVRRTDKGKGRQILIQDNFYYLCQTGAETIDQDLDGYEAEERFTLEWAAPETAIAANLRPDHGPKSAVMLRREARVLETLIQEGYFPKED